MADHFDVKLEELIDAEVRLRPTSNACSTCWTGPGVLRHPGAPVETAGITARDPRS